MSNNLNSQKVSIIVPVHNSQKFLVNSIESLINQTYKNIEILTIDDGSTDDSLKILKQYDNKITIISQPNRGLAGALNTGIKNMTGDWMKWFSPDDILYPNAIEVLITEAKKLPSNTIIYSNWEMIDEKGIKLRNFSESNYNHLDNFEFNVRLLDEQQINVNTALIPKYLFDNGCSIRELNNPVTIDYDFFLRAGILYDTKFHLITCSLLKYRIHKGQLSHYDVLQTFPFLSKVRQEILSKLDEKEKNQYLHALQNYNKRKSFVKKSMELGMKIGNYILPKWIMNNIIMFYLNNIRRTR